MSVQPKVSFRPPRCTLWHPTSKESFTWSFVRENRNNLHSLESLTNKHRCGDRQTSPKARSQRDNNIERTYLQKRGDTDLRISQERATSQEHKSRSTNSLVPRALIEDGGVIVPDYGHKASRQGTVTVENVWGGIVVFLYGTKFTIGIEVEVVWWPMEITSAVEEALNELAGAEQNTVTKVRIIYAKASDGVDDHVRAYEEAAREIADLIQERTSVVPGFWSYEFWDILQWNNFPVNAGPLFSWTTNRNGDIIQTELLHFFVPEQPETSRESLLYNRLFGGMVSRLNIYMASRSKIQRLSDAQFYELELSDRGDAMSTNSSGSMEVDP